MTATDASSFSYDAPAHHPTLLDVIRSDEMHRLRLCGAPDCDGVLIDLSRNGSKQYCSVRCGNRMNMIAFRERAASAPD